MKLLEGKTAIITGATRGIGKGIAEQFSAHGADVAFTYASSASKAEALEKKLAGQNGTKAKSYKSDAANFDAAGKLIEDVVKDFGKIDIIVNNAGITRDGLLMRMTEEDWDQVINTNLKSVFNMYKASLKTFLKQRHGSIINIASIVGLEGNAGQANYAASKAGLIGLTKSMAKELGKRNIRSNVIAPGFIQTEMTDRLGEDQIKDWVKDIPLARPGLPEDVANTALYLASDLSTYITGQVISVCGGMHT